MPDSSTWPAFKAALLTKLEASISPNRLGLWWPGDLTEGEGVYLADVEGEKEPASIKTGRQRRNETYRVGFVCQSETVGPNKAALTAAGAAVAAYEAIIDGALADDPECSNTVAWSAVTGFTVGAPVEMPRGVAIRLLGSISVTARLS